jgi:hypothetical protein
MNRGAEAETAPCDEYSRASIFRAASTHLSRGVCGGHSDSKEVGHLKGREQCDATPD